MSLCLDEPYTEDQNMVMMSGIEVSLYSGGKLAGAASDVPPVDTGNEGDVLTIVSGEPAWAPPSGGGGGSGVTTVVGWPTPYYLYAYAGAAVGILPLHVPIGPGTLGGGAAPGTVATPDLDEFVFASGTGTSIVAALPVTIDGQRLATPRGGYSSSFILETVPTGGFNIKLDWTTNTTVSGRILLGSSPNTDANSYTPFNYNLAGSELNKFLSFSVNTTSSNSAQPTIVATFGASRAWTLSVQRYSLP